MTNLIQPLIISITFYTLGTIITSIIFRKLYENYKNTYRNLNKELKELKDSFKVRVKKYSETLLKKNEEIGELKTLTTSKRQEIIEDFMLFLIKETKTNSHLQKITWGMLKNKYLEKNKNI